MLSKEIGDLPVSFFVEVGSVGEIGRHVEACLGAHVGEGEEGNSLVNFSGEEISQIVFANIVF